MTDEQKAWADAPEMVAERPGKRWRKRIQGLSPVQRENVAQWIEAKYAKAGDRLVQMEAWLQQHPDDVALRNEAHYWRTAIAVSKFLAYWMRTELSA